MRPLPSSPCLLLQGLPLLCDSNLPSPHQCRTQELPWHIPRKVTWQSQKPHDPHPHRPEGLTVHNRNPTRNQCPRRRESPVSSQRLVRTRAHGDTRWDTAPDPRPRLLSHLHAAWETGRMKKGQARQHLPRGADCWDGPFSGPVLPGFCLSCFKSTDITLRSGFRFIRVEMTAPVCLPSSATVANTLHRCGTPAQRTTRRGHVSVDRSPQCAFRVIFCHRTSCRF